MISWIDKYSILGMHTFIYHNYTESSDNLLLVYMNRKHEKKSLVQQVPMPLTIKFIIARVHAQGQ